MWTLRAKFWGLRLALVFLGFLPFIAIEIALRLAWTQRPTSISDPFLDCSQLSPLFELHGEVYQTSSERLKIFLPTQFPSKKEPMTKRIFCLGGSTTQGEPYKHQTAFPAWLQLNLQLIEPNQHFEFVNCGGLSYASYRLLPMLVEILQYEPDLVFIECGHNEFLEERELSGWKQTSMLQKSAMHIARSSRLVQFTSQTFSNLFPAITVASSRTQLEQEVDALLDDHGGLEKYKRDELHVESIVKSMNWNITAMIEHCKAANVPLVLLVPTANIRDCPPFKVEVSRHMDSASKEQIELHWALAMNAQKNLDSGEETSARELRNILAIDAEHATALYWLGQVELANGEIDSASQHLIRARDSDVCPLRAVSSMQKSIHELAIEKNVWCFDIDAMFQSVSADRLVGDRWLVDHVHPRIEGHQLLSEQLADLLIEKRWITAKDKNWPSQRVEVYRKHLQELGEDYFIRGKQRLAGLILWTQGRARKGLIYPNTTSSITVEKTN